MSNPNPPHDDGPVAGMYALTVDILAAALPDVADEATTLEVYGPGVHPFDVDEEWFMSPRELAQEILNNLNAARQMK